MPRSFDEVFGEIAGLLRNFEGREYSGEITAHTRFFDDLGCASIDAVVLGEQLEQHFGQKLPFNDLLMDLGNRGATDLEIGELARFVHRYLS
jgi:acyl carrier protein